MRPRSLSPAASVLTALTCLFATACTDLPPQPTQVTSAKTQVSGTGAPPSTSTGTAPKSSTPPPGTNPATAPGIDELRVALDLVEREYPAGTKSQVSCVGDRLVRQPELVVPAQSTLDQLDLSTRKKIVDLLADCIGPDLLLVLYEAGHPVSPETRQCTYRALALNRPLDEAVDIVAGEPEPAQRFADDLPRLCPSPSPGGTTSAPQT